MSLRLHLVMFGEFGLARATVLVGVEHAEVSRHCVLGWNLGLGNLAVLVLVELDELGIGHLAVVHGHRAVHLHLAVVHRHLLRGVRSEEHTYELQSLMRISYSVFCLKKKKKINTSD